MGSSAIGLEHVVANSLSSLSFSGFTLFIFLVIGSAVWCAVPLVLMAMSRRIKTMERVIAENSSILGNDVRRISDILLLDRMQAGHRPAQAAPAAPPEPAANDHRSAPLADFRTMAETIAEPKPAAPRFIPGRQQAMRVHAN